MASFAHLDVIARTVQRFSLFLSLGQLGDEKIMTEFSVLGELSFEWAFVCQGIVLHHHLKTVFRH